MKKLIFSAIVVCWCAQSWAKKLDRVCTEIPMLIIMEEKLGNKTTEHIMVCDTQVKTPRFFSKGEILRMYNASKDELAFWGEQLGVEPNQDAIVQSLRELPDRTMPITDTRENLLKFESIYEKAFYPGTNVPLNVIDTDEERQRAISQRDHSSLAACLFVQGNATMSDGGNGCTCGNQPMPNVVDYICNKKGGEPRIVTRTPENSGPKTLPTNKSAGAQQ